jgi:hypothetical protein
MWSAWLRAELCVPGYDLEASLVRKILGQIPVIALLSCLSVISLSPVFAQNHVPPPPVGGISFDDVIKLSHAGLSDKVILAQIRMRQDPFVLSPDQLIQLKTAHVSDAVIEAMSGTVTTDPPLVAQKSAAVKQATVVDTTLPSEIGIYAKQKSGWVEVLPEVANWKTGGVLQNVASVGIVKGDVNGHVNGASSPNRLAAPAEFLVITPDGTAITEYQLLELRRNGTNREFRIVTGGVLHVSSGATRDLLTFEGKKVAPRTYCVTFPSTLRAGEYGFLPPGAIIDKNGAGSQGKLYSFEIME